MLAASLSSGFSNQGIQTRSTVIWLKTSLQVANPEIFRVPMRHDHQRKIFSAIGSHLIDGILDAAEVLGVHPAVDQNMLVALGGRHCQKKEVAEANPKNAYTQPPYIVGRRRLRGRCASWRSCDGPRLLARGFAVRNLGHARFRLLGGLPF